jgi:pyridoxine 4-dehydrogenase
VSPCHNRTVAAPPATAKLGERSILRIGLGTNRLTDSEKNRSFLRGAVEAGLELIDTAHSYSDGDSERTIGAVFGGGTDAAPAIATKGGFSSNHPDELREQLDTSLERLGHEPIDLYYVHRLDPKVPTAETMGLLSGYVEAGRIRHVGLSEVAVEQIEEAREVVPIAAVQNDFSLAERKHEEVVDFCEREGILFVPFFPLRGEPAALAEIAARHDATPAQIKLAWLLHRSPCVVPIPGTLSPGHLEENLRADSIELESDDLQRLTDR